ncbi:MAG: FAD/NAD(P)-binding protein [Steroidobacteraceae bacterium]|jgi:uncharacterized NAD(P)/FAD-binding protein YdhS|nr:FAD/NAD(P)-binding protein [Steroidobacteraceae bacterium]
MLNARSLHDSRWHDHLRSTPPPPSIADTFTRRRARRSHPHRTWDVAIIGLGPAGLAALLGIIRHARRPLSLLVVDPADRPGGDAYRRARPEHLLNARAASMSVDPEDPDSFSHWLGRRERRPAQEVADSYARRDHYGEYLDDMRMLAISLANDSGHLIFRVRQGTVDIAEADGKWELHFDHGEARLAQHVVLATGPRSRRDWNAGADPARAAASPWELDYEEAVRRHGTGSALIAGGGLSGVDAVLSLAAAGWTGTITVASAQGALPARHGAMPPAATVAPRAALAAGSARTLLRDIRRALESDVIAGRDWRTRVQLLREDLPVLWPRLSPAERRRLLRHAAGLWNRHRHRMAPVAAARIEDLVRSGQLRVEPWRVTAVAAGPGPLAIRVRDRGGEHRTVEADVFIAAPGLDLAAGRDPLVGRLLTRGLVAASATGLGLGVEAVGTAVSRRRHGCSLHAIGAPLVGERLESTAVLELVAQARLAARELAALLGQSRLAGVPAGRAEPLFSTD